MATTLLDRLFTPHGPDAYLRWVPTVGRGRSSPSRRSSRGGSGSEQSNVLNDEQVLALRT